MQGHGLSSRRTTSTALGRRVTIPEIQIGRIANSEIVERWFVVDRSDLQQTSPVTGMGEIGNRAQ